MAKYTRTLYIPLFVHLKLKPVVVMNTNKFKTYEYITNIFHSGNIGIRISGRKQNQSDLLLPFLTWTDRDDRSPADSAMEPEVDTGLRWKTPESRLVWRRMRLLLGCLTATPSADLQVEELPVDTPDLEDGAAREGTDRRRRSGKSSTT